jgi:SAM-dependent methyltransferase
VETRAPDTDSLSKNGIAAAGGVPDGGSAAIFNAAVAAWAIAAAWEVGALDELAAARKLDVQDFAERHRLDTTATIGMFRALAAVRIVERTDSTVVVADLFDDVYRNKAFFHWLSRGSGELFRQMPAILPVRNRIGRYYQRDAAAIAFACRELDELCYAPTFWSALERGPAPRVVADLGCGSGDRLLQILRRYPGSNAIGIDIAAPAVEMAERDLAAAGLADRSTFLTGDVRYLQPQPAFAEVDTLTCFMMGHDFWPRDNCIATLRRLRQLFPNVRRFLLGDATRTQGVPDAALPVFTLGFELGHDLMGTVIPTLDDWLTVFEEGGWQLAHTHRIDLTVGEVIFELR